MMRSHSQPPLQALMKKGPVWLDGWLRQFEEGKEPPDNRMNGVSEVAAFMAREQSSLEWAEIAIRAADLWLQLGVDEREHALNRAMRLRAWFISKMGATPGHPILDRDVILRWFGAELKISMDLARERIARWKDSRVPFTDRLPKDQILELRRIKTRLAVIKVLADCGQLSVDSEARAWLDIRDQLP